MEQFRDRATAKSRVSISKPVSRAPSPLAVLRPNMWARVALQSNEVAQKAHQRELNQQSSSDGGHRSSASQGTGSVDSTHRNHVTKEGRSASVLSKFRAGANKVNNKVLTDTKKRQKAEEAFRAVGNYEMLEGKL